jgi:hypothetical protein
VTDQRGDARLLERDHRARGDAENRVRNAKDCGMRNLPFTAFAHNEVWLEVVLIALDLVAWTQALLLDGAVPTRHRAATPATTHATTRSRHTTTRHDAC